MTPYSNLPARNFWSPAVGKRKALQIDELWVPKWQVTPQTRVVTFGSCFAQHFSKALVARGYAWTNMEPGPAGLGPEGITKFNYDVFSARTGNIYTANILRQWCDWAAGTAVPPDEAWEAEGRFYDPFRPAIEPGGFESREEMQDSRALTIEAFGEAIRKADVFVFTLGLTESWRSADQTCEYALCPGTVAGEFDPEAHVFVNESYPNIAKSLRQAIAVMHGLNPKLRVLLTVSPVPLTATATDAHVLVATTYSKSVLRAVAGDVAANRALIDYFPSYEIIVSPPYGGQFFADNKRSVMSARVDHVMAQFFAGQEAKYGPAPEPAEPPAVQKRKAAAAAATEAGLVCEEALLAAFGPGV